MTAEIKQIGKYSIQDVLGRGAMGIVYKGFDPMIERYVAIKTLASQNDPGLQNEIRRRFKREAQAAGNLNHPGIVSIHEYGEDAGLAYIVMEYVDGQTLSDRMKQEVPLTVEQSAHIAQSILSALLHAHAMGLVHRDIKPGNIMLAANGAVKVADFGIVRVESSELTLTGTIIGTPGYMSPEQLKGETVDLRSDLFSTGVILYEMLTGQKAFAGSTIASVIYKVINQELPPPSQHRQAIPDGLDIVVAKGVAKMAATRYQTAQQFIDAIETATMNIAEPRHARMNRSAAHDTPDDKATLIEQPSARPRKKRIVYASGAIVILAAILMGLLVRFGPETKEIAAPMPRYGEVFKDCETCPSLVVIPPGIFTQGSPSTSASGEASKAHVRKVHIEYALAVGRFEVTRDEFEAFVDDTQKATAGCTVYDGRWQNSEEMSWKHPGYDQDGRHPVTCVSWEDAQAYTRWLSRKTNESYRLLSASEWEYVARNAGKTYDDSSADPNMACNAGNVADRVAARQYPGWQVSDCSDNFVHTAPVGSYNPNEVGVHDLTGNVFEWVEDCWNDDDQSAPDDGSAWRSGDCERRELRGGSWYSRPQYLSFAFRNSFKSDYRSSSFGFRVAKELKP